MITSRVDALRALLDAAISDLRSSIELECRPFFGGAAEYANGRIFMTLTFVGVALKLPGDSRTALRRRGSTPLRYFPDGPVKKDNVIVPDRIARSPVAFAPWVVKSIRFSQTFDKRTQRARSA
jgi:TfoX/Sxy family transcriptional regulator of competence genes